MTEAIRRLRRNPLPIALFVLALAPSIPARAQDAKPSPSPSPVASPAPVVDAPVVAIESPVVEVDAVAMVEKIQNQARRDVEIALRGVEANRAAIERGSVLAAKSMAKTDAVRSRAAMEANLVARAAMREALREAEFEAETEAHEGAHAFEFLQDAQSDAREKALEKRELEREKAREARNRAREKAQQAREDEQAARERQRESVERVDELYEQAMEMIDEEEWSEALRPLSRLMSLNTRLDAALYWSGYAQGKMNRTASALASLARLQKEFPGSRWAREGKALEMEVRGKSGQVPRPDQEDDIEMKLMALSALAQSDPQEAMPMLAKILASTTAPRKVRERTLFVLAQIGSEQAGNAIAEVARGNASPELQRKAIQYLGVFGGQGNRKILSDVYATTSDNALRKQILHSFMVSGDKVRVLNAAKTEKDPALRSEAVRLLGVMGGSSELSQMYGTAASVEEKKAILHALFLSGAIEPVATAAKGEKDKEVRLAAVRHLGLMGRNSETVLSEMYRIEPDFEVKKEVLNAFFLQGNSIRLVEIARVEKDTQLKKEAVHWLSLMNSKESRAFMLELLKD